MVSNKYELEFIEKANNVHGLNTYLYNRLGYKNSKTKVLIGCPRHNEYFEQFPYAHLKGQGCKKCFIDRKTKTTEQFIKEMKDLHGDLYTYEDTVYVRNNLPLKISCRIHGVWEAKPSNLLCGKTQCPKCMCPNWGRTTDDVRREAIEVHGARYNYDKLIYVSTDIPFVVICKEHGEFLTGYEAHVRNSGNCRKCTGYIKKTNDEFIRDSRNVHGDLYLYDKVQYINANTHVEITCSKHGSFTVTPNNHLSLRSGCPSCYNKSEARIKQFLNRYFPELEVIHDRQWIEVMDKRRPDFRIPTLKLILEFDGKQHFEDIPNREPAKWRQIIDTIKVLQASKAEYSTLRIHYLLLEEQNWEQRLIPHIKRYNTPEYIFSHEYPEHKELYLKYRGKYKELVGLLNS